MLRWAAGELRTGYAAQKNGKGPWYVQHPTIRQIAPQFFTMEMAQTLAYYKDRLGFDCVGTWHDPAVYAIVARDEHRIHFRLADPPTPNKYADELLDAYLFIEDADALRRIRRAGSRVHASPWRHGLALALVCREGL